MDVFVSQFLYTKMQRYREVSNPMK